MAIIVVQSGPGPGAGGPSTLPNVMDNGHSRNLKTCDHVVVDGVWVIDAGHTMYGPHPYGREKLSIGRTTKKFNLEKLTNLG